MLWLPALKTRKTACGRKNLSSRTSGLSFDLGRLERLRKRTQDDRVSSSSRTCRRYAPDDGADAKVQLHLPS